MLLIWFNEYTYYWILDSEYKSSISLFFDAFIYKKYLALKSEVIFHSSQFQGFLLSNLLLKIPK